MHSICKICRWQDDGQDDNAWNPGSFPPDVVLGGPNLYYSLSQSRANFDKFGTMFDPGKNENIRVYKADLREKIRALFDEILTDNNAMEKNVAEIRRLVLDERASRYAASRARANRPL